MPFRSLDNESALYDHLDSTGTSVTQIGTSVDDRPIRMVTLGSGDRADILFLGAQHGPELAGREALLDLLDAYSSGDSTVQDLFSGLKVCIVATVNPDGVDSGDRENSNDADLNRDWIRHDQPETRAVAEVVRDQRPKVAVDAHEATGIIDDDSDVEFRGSAHPLVHPGTGDMAEALQDRLISHLAGQGWTTDRYGRDDRHGGLTNADPNFGVRHVVTVLTETNRAEGYTAADRTAIQDESFREILRWTSSNLSTLTGLRAQAEAWATEQGENATPIRLAGGRTLDPPPIGFDLTGDHMSRSEFHRSVWWITDEYQISLERPWWNGAPLLFDAQSEGSILPAIREYREGDQPEDDYLDDWEGPEEEEEPGESSWEALERLGSMTDPPCIRFSFGSRILFGSVDWLADGMALSVEGSRPFRWGPDADGVVKINSIEWDVGQRADSASLDIVTPSVHHVPPGAPVMLDVPGRAGDGLWLIDRVDWSPFSRVATVNLTRPAQLRDRIPDAPAIEEDEPDDDDPDSPDSPDSGGGGDHPTSGTFGGDVIAWYALNAGLSGSTAVLFTAIALSESSGNVRAYNPRGLDLSYGWWQINMHGSLGPARRAALGISSNDELFHPVTNARGMMLVSDNGSNPRPWSDYTNGRYRSHMGEAERGVANPRRP